jgi:plastocyanin
MAIQWRNSVQRQNPEKPKGFDPASRQTQVGDAIFFDNTDESEEHQPYLKTKGDWGPVITAGNPGEQVDLNSAAVYEYGCCIHPDEKGTLIVSTGVMIGDSPAGGAGFDAASIAIAAGQSVSWGNSSSEAHQPTPASGAPWFTEPIEPTMISAPVTFDTAGVITYGCAIPGHKETGTITVSNSVTIATADTGNASFAPETVNVAAGQSVRWINNDLQSHQPTPDTGAAWFTAAIAPLATSGAITFATAGPVPYHCSIHPTEKGTVNVT